MEICGAPVRQYRPDELLPHCAELSANFADEFTSARGLMASLRQGRCRNGVAETALTNYISLLRSRRRNSVTLVTRMDRDGRTALTRGICRFVKYFRSFFPPGRRCNNSIRRDRRPRNYFGFDWHAKIS